MSVEVRGNLEIAMKRFKTQLARSGSLQKVRERSDGYKKPGIKNREAIKQGIKNSRKKGNAHRRSAA
ncbi:MAG: 30S ribosomal protein S21 [Tenericutes bacterium]|nr:30S ribosomal protein S21 [Mycoplasmatota bacterium]